MTSTLATDNIFEAISIYAAKRICTQWNFGLLVSEELHAQALVILEPLKPEPVEYLTTVDDLDDWQFDEYMRERSEWKQQFIDKWEYKHG